MILLQMKMDIHCRLPRDLTLTVYIVYIMIHVLVYVHLLIQVCVINTVAKVGVLYYLTALVGFFALTKIPFQSETG